MDRELSDVTWYTDDTLRSMTEAATDSEQPRTRIRCPRECLECMTIARHMIRYTDDREERDVEPLKKEHRETRAMLPGVWFFVIDADDVAAYRRHRDAVIGVKERGGEKLRAVESR